jgi:general nucleoside transport system permease protein
VTTTQTSTPPGEVPRKTPLALVLIDRLDARNRLLLPLLAIVSALIVGSVLIALTEGPAKIIDAYVALIRAPFSSIRGVSETMVYSAPLILTGLSVTIGFRSGLFNIGATGQMLAGVMAAVYVGFRIDVPGVIHVPLAVLAGAVGGAAYGAIPGVLKARTGAHEVITTIMLNNIAFLAVLWLLKTEMYQVPGRNDPISRTVANSGRLPRLFGFMDRPDLRAHAGFLLALAAVWLVWWILFRSTLGFQLRAVGANAEAARYAGMKPARLTITAMVLAGALAGLAGACEVLGTQGRATQSIAGDIGFDGIAVALLGRTTPFGTLAAALLFGALQTGGQKMQADAGVAVDLIVVLRALIVMFIAAPLLMKAVWRIKTTEDMSMTQAFKGWGA